MIYRTLGNSGLQVSAISLGSWTTYGGSVEESDATAIVHRAFELGINLFDTADVYVRGNAETVLGRALRDLPREQLVIATKCMGRVWDGPLGAGLSRKHIFDAIDQSLKRLGVDYVDLYQLHAPDPRTPLSTSVRALASLKRDGLIESIGLCNVNVGQIDEARSITEIAAVQAEVSVWNDDNFLSGVAEYCIANGILLLAHRPLGGSQRRRRTLSDPVLTTVAARHDATPFEIALAWLRDLSSLVVPLPGPTRVETAQSAARAHEIVLTDDDRTLLDERFPSGRALRLRRSPGYRPAPEEEGQASRTASEDAGEVVLIMGLPGAGKSTLAESYVARGYERLNRDERGGSLRALLPSITSGSSRTVLDNTYVSRKSRAAVVQTAA